MRVDEDKYDLNWVVGNLLDELIRKGTITKLDVDAILAASKKPTD